MKQTLAGTSFIAESSTGFSSKLVLAESVVDVSLSEGPTILVSRIPGRKVAREFEK